MTSRRVAWIVLDGAGAGEAADAARYGDSGADTLRHVLLASPDLRLPTLEALGLFRLLALPARSGSAVEGAWARMSPQSAGKDSVTGHWEMCGVVTERAFPTYPAGFPPELVRAFEVEIGRGILGNEAASGTEILTRLGDEHVRTGQPIVYTSADSVFQVAAHEAVVPVEQLHAWCESARKLLAGAHRVGRVIARPFDGASGAYRRTEHRRDWTVAPPHPTLLDALAGSGRAVWGVGKISDLFSGQGITRSWHPGNNADALLRATSALADMPPGLLFVNLVDFDQRYGHRNDVAGFARGLAELDDVLPALRKAMHPDDVLFLTADHGNDPTTPSTDHDRELVPVLAVGGPIRPGTDAGLRPSLADLGATTAEALSVRPPTNGHSFWRLIAAG